MGKDITKALLISSSIFLTINIFSQSRENRVNLTFDSKSEKLTSAIGWKINKETGKWFDNNNVIDDKPYSKNFVGNFQQNFTWIQFATVKQNGINLYVLLYERLGGEYKYLYSKEEWETNKHTYFSVIDTEEYEKLQNAINDKGAINIKITSKISGVMSDRNKISEGENLYNDEILLAKITTALEKKGYSETCFIINSQQVDGIDVVRFKLPESCFLVGKDLKEAYFEVKFVEFTKILLK